MEIQVSSSLTQPFVLRRPKAVSKGERLINENP